ncbi:hypothetical protein MHBO_003856 [Bonamia ostreae]|uniref:UMA domain-containing protein n=1 Tax=Bonamia ostreae TaxID=126728 RepID=A0ABV2ARQ8_9EUKA
MFFIFNKFKDRYGYAAPPSTKSDSQTTSEDSDDESSLPNTRLVRQNAQRGIRPTQIQKTNEKKQNPNSSTRDLKINPLYVPADEFGRSVYSLATSIPTEESGYYVYDEVSF